MTCGFTLIELLVVVLIIGILAAVAVPQYQKAVKKSKLSTVFPLVKAVKEAEEMFWLENGYYTDSFADLSIEPPANANFVRDGDPGWMYIGEEGEQILIDIFFESPGPITDTDSERAVIQAGLRANSSSPCYVVYGHFLTHSAYPNKIFCSREQEICQSLGGKEYETLINGEKVWEIQ